MLNLFCEREKTYFSVSFGWMLCTNLISSRMVKIPVSVTCIRLLSYCIFRLPCSIWDVVSDVDHLITNPKKIATIEIKFHSNFNYSKQIHLHNYTGVRKLMSQNRIPWEPLNSFSTNDNIEVCANDTDLGESACNMLSHLKSALFAF